MRIVVCVKQVYDPSSVKISRSREELDLRGASKISNRPDRYALEAALRLREARGGEVIALTVGDAGAEDVLHEAIAMGAQSGMLVAAPDLGRAAGSAVTHAAAAAIRRLHPVDLVLTGEIGLTDGAGSLAGRLGAALSWPVVLDALRLASAPDGSLEALVNFDGEGRLVPIDGPAVVSVAQGAEQPRWPHAARIANAWQPGLVEVCTPSDLGLEADALVNDTESGGLILSAERTRGQVLNGTTTEAATAVVELLKGWQVI